MQIGETRVSGCHRYTLTERSGDSSCYLVSPDFDPRKADHAKTEAMKGIDLLNENKEILLEKLHCGQGDLTLQEWDNFLADLEEMGIITHDERFYANGTLHEIPAKSSGFCSEMNPDDEWEMLWTGDPVQWLNDADLYMLKYQLYAHMAGGIVDNSVQRAAYCKLLNIVKELCS